MKYRVNTKFCRSPIQYAWAKIFSQRGTRQQCQELENLFPSSSIADLMGLSYIHKIVLGILNLSLEDEVRKPHYREQINVCDSYGRSPFLWAIDKGDDEAARILLQNGADINLADNRNKTPLQSALLREPINQRCVELLLRGDADVHGKSSFGWQAIHFASRNPTGLKAVEALLAAGVSVDSELDLGSTALSTATVRDNHEIADFLLQKGTDLNHADREGDTPISDALGNKAYKCLELFLGRGAHYRMVNKAGRTLFHHIAQFGDVRIVGILKLHGVMGVDPLAKDVKGITARCLLNRRVGMPKGLAKVFEQLLLSVQEANNTSPIVHEIFNDGEEEFVQALEAQEVDS